VEGLGLLCLIYLLVMFVLSLSFWFEGTHLIKGKKKTQIFTSATYYKTYIITFDLN